MKWIPPTVAAVLLAGCGNVTITTSDSISATELEQFFRKHAVDGNHAVALKKRSFDDAYLATVHGYPDNLAVCESLIAPYNEDQSKSVMPGRYFCEELR